MNKRGNQVENLQPCAAFELLNTPVRINDVTLSPQRQTLYRLLDHLRKLSTRIRHTFEVKLQLRSPFRRTKHLFSLL